MVGESLVVDIFSVVVGGEPVGCVEIRLPWNRASTGLDLNEKRLFI